MASEDVPDDPGRGVPGLDRAVVAAREDGLAVGREDQPADRVGVSGEGDPGLAGGGVPQPHRAVRAAGGDGAAVGAERDAHDATRCDP